MKNLKLQTSIKFVLFTFALIMAIAVLWINSTIITNLREGNRKQIEKIAEYYSKELSDSEKQDYTYFAEVILPILYNFEFPIIITNEAEGDNSLFNFLTPINIKIKHKENSLEYIKEVKGLIKKMDKNFIPYEITGDDGTGTGNQIVYHKIHYGDQEIIKTSFGKFNAIVVSPVSNNDSSIIRNNGDMKIWFTNDENRYPIKIELKINYGRLVLLLNDIE